ncbi:hypothetical protein HHK36_030328 [Tetracentron sinense]|uniref:Uncharacterized protein n=1 Tax=Tetracentron sinense TaxID=13715 RepID=A0A835CY53_TETSI|nr:hypothetical protein HHK36_030328 [Tetracentron sinense]
MWSIFTENSRTVKEIAVINLDPNIPFNADQNPDQISGSSSSPVAEKENAINVRSSDPKNLPTSEMALDNNSNSIQRTDDTIPVAIEKGKDVLIFDKSESLIPYVSDQTHRIGEPSSYNKQVATVENGLEENTVALICSYSGHSALILGYLLDMDPTVEILRSPSVRHIIFPRFDFTLHRFKVISYWKDMREFSSGFFHVICVNTFKNLNACVKNLSILDLYGVLGDEGASVMATGFPRLRYLRLCQCVLSVDALSIILDGHKKLLELDVRHAVCTDHKYL